MREDDIWLHNWDMLKPIGNPFLKVIKELSMAKEVKDAPVFESTGRECKEVHFGQSIQIGVTGLSNLNAAHEAFAKKMESKIFYVGHGVEFKFDGKDCLVPMSVIKLIIFA